MLQTARADQSVQSRRARSDRAPTSSIRWSRRPSSLIADRDTFYGDPDFVEVPVDDAAVGRLQRRAQETDRRARLARAAAGHDSRLRQRACAARGGRRARGRGRRGRADGRQDLDARRKRDPGVISVEAAQARCAPASCAATPCISTSSTSNGNMVSSTPSGGWLQSSPTIPELGFCLGTRAQQFWLDEGHPSALAPGKRPRSTLTPSLALRDGEPYLAWGSPGGDQQDQWIAQFFLRHVHAGMNLQEAIDAPAWHSEHFLASFWPREARPGVLVVESRVRRGDDQGIARARPRGRSRPGLVGRAADGRLARRQAPPRRRQSARHAGLRRRALTARLTSCGCGK